MHEREMLLFVSDVSDADVLSNYMPLQLCFFYGYGGHAQQQVCITLHLNGMVDSCPDRLFCLFYQL